MSFGDNTGWTSILPVTTTGY